MSKSVLLPSNADVENVTAFANYNAGSSSYSQDDVKVVLNLLYSEYLSVPGARVCWDAREKMYTAVAAKLPVVVNQVKSILRTKAQDEDYAQKFIRTVIWNFLSTLENGKITSVAKPQCLEVGSKEVAGKGDGSVDGTQAPPKPNSLLDDLAKNPVAIGGVVIGALGIGFAVWKLRK